MDNLNKTFNISMPKSLLDAIDKQAEVEFRNRSDLIREACRTYLSVRGGLNTKVNLSSEEESRIREAFTFGSFGTEPALTVSCSYRPQPNGVKDVFSSKSPIIDMLEKPSRIRAMGWDLDTLDNARPVAGEYLELANGKRKVIRLYRDGQFIVAGGMDFFGHGTNKSDEEFGLNLLSITELVTNFVDTAYKIKDHFTTSVDSLIFTIAISNPSNPRKPLAIHAYDGISADKVGELQLNWAERNVPIHLSDELNENRAAYLICAELSAFFGMRNDEMWYTNREKQEISRSNFK